MFGIAETYFEARTRITLRSNRDQMKIYNVIRRDDSICDISEI